MSFLLYILGCSLNNFIRVTLIGSFLVLILFFPVFCAGRRSIGCIGSKVVFLCVVVCLPTYLTGWIDSFWFPFTSGTVLVFMLMFVLSLMLLGIDLLAPLFSFPGFFLVSSVCLFGFLVNSTDRCIVVVFYSGGTSVWVCRHLCLQF